ncbi:MAG TPA: TolC family protein [Pyrinomonadaceae bacterium]|nr:TolC family protein [Pyrinomonadaceae bacterium]HMP64078.1 TolC family protein [Pyrinomonadaceae bacterium]
MNLRYVIAGIFASVVLAAVPSVAFAQHPAASTALSYAKYLNETDGRSVDDLVKAALANNLEVIAMSKEAEAGEALIRQARLRANPSLEVSGTRQIGGMGDNSVMVQGALPLELGGRRAARINVAEKELEIRRQALAELERQLAADVRAKFGEALAAIFKLKFTEDILVTAEQNVQLVSARVTEGRTPPLEESQEFVELNRIRAVRERSEGAVEIRLFELRNLVGMGPEEPLVLKGDLNTLSRTLPPQIGAEQTALRLRPDLLGAIAVEKLAAARVGQARSEGRIDADVMIGYQRMQSGFPLLGVDEMSGALLPIEQRMNFFTFGVRLNLPVRNRNQGLVAASLLEEQAARNRREFGELTIRREIAVAYARYNRAFRAMEIYRVGVRDRAADNAEVVRQTYELGSKTLLDYIAEHHRYIETENGFIDAQLEAYLAMVEILKATNDPALK